MIYAVENVARTHPSRSGAVLALAGVSFAIEAGEHVALLGPSGAGKTTLFRLLNATLRPTSGTVRFAGRDLAELSASELRRARTRIGTIFQQPRLVPSLSARANALAGRLGHWSPFAALRAAVLPARADLERADAALEVVGLADKRHARADELSGGQQQRVAIARVLVQDPDVILADEPFASLDPALTETVGELLLGVAAAKRTLVTTMHDTNLALRLFPRTIGLAEGRLRFDARSGDVDARVLDELYRTGESADAGPEESTHARPVAPRCAR